MNINIYSVHVTILQSTEQVKKIKSFKEPTSKVVDKCVKGVEYIIIGKIEKQ